MVQCEGETGGQHVTTLPRGQGGFLSSEVCLSRPSEVRELSMQVLVRKQVQAENTDRMKT